MTNPDHIYALPDNVNGIYAMPHAILSRLKVIDVVPFGNTGSHTGFYALRLTPPAWKSWKSGQFVMLRPAREHSEILWGRPFSICQATDRHLVIFFQERGRATSLMSGLLSGDEVDVWGPLGNALAMEARTPTLLLAGGIGIAPFVGYVHAHPTPWDVTMEFGHRLPLDCYPFDSINEKAMANTHLEKNDHDRQVFLELVEQKMQAIAAADGLTLACGPTPFLEAVQIFSQRHGARTQLCLETRMACGIGACLGCVVKALPSSDQPSATATEPKNVQTCSCGPNFWADSVSLR